MERDFEQLFPVEQMNDMNVCVNTGITERDREREREIERERERENT